MKSKKREVAKIEADKKYEEDGNSSDDEMPEVVSNATMKSNYELLNQQLQDLKQQIRQTEKAKRRQKQEVCIAQKKKKQAKIFEYNDEPKSGNSTSFTDIASQNQKKDPAQPITQHTRTTKKVYPSFNISVEPLTNVKDSRASAAIDFRSRRMNKLPRESVKDAVISYNKKLKVRK